MNGVNKLTHQSLDIVISSYRFTTNEHHLLKIAALKYPTEWKVQIYIVGDNPDVPVPSGLQHLIDTEKIIFVRNDTNRGISYCRNRGLELSTAAWILFLDDDVIPSENLLIAFIDAITHFPDVIGFAGVVNFPEPGTPFTKALELSGYTNYFSAAKYRTSLPWPIGANMLFNREKIRNLRFLEEFSKVGGGEEVDFAIRVKLTAEEHFLSVPDASTLHPWWNEGKPNFSRPFNYSQANYLLLKRHPQYAIWRFCNSLELLFFLLLFMPFAAIAGVDAVKYLLFIISVLLIDFGVHILKISREKRTKSFIVLYYTWRIKLAEQLGFLTICIRKFYLKGFFTKFNFELSPLKMKHFHTNRWIILRIMLIVISFIAFFLVL
jgi:GT2 family glycosyltransferase